MPAKTEFFRKSIQKLEVSKNQRALFMSPFGFFCL